jgi:hypothetical protein
MNTLHPDQILRILEITDSFNLHRESIFIPLRSEEKGSVAILPDGRLRIVCPETGPFEAWLVQLRDELEKLDLSKVKQ